MTPAGIVQAILASLQGGFIQGIITLAFAIMAIRALMTGHLHMAYVTGGAAAFLICAPYISQTWFPG